MEELNKEIKNKKVLFLIAAAGAILSVGFFVFYFISTSEKPKNSVVSERPKEKTMEDLKKEFSTLVNPGVESAPVSEGFIKSLNLPFDDYSGTESKITKSVQVSPVSQDFLKSLSVPVVK